MQPRVGINLRAVGKTKFTKIYAGLGGTDSYTNAISDFYYYILLKSDPLGVEYRFLDYRISSLYHFSNIGEIETCNTIVKVLLEMIVVPEDIKVLESGKNRILMLLTKVKDTDKII